MKKFNIDTKVLIADNPDNLDKDLVNDWVKRLFNDWTLSDDNISSFNVSIDIKSGSDMDTITISGCILSPNDDVEFMTRNIRKNLVRITTQLCEKFIESIVYKTSYLEVTY